MNNSIVSAYKDIDRIHSIDRDREETQSLIEFQEWCRSMNIGSRIVRRDSRATELMDQYGNYAKWVKQKY